MAEEREKRASGMMVTTGFQGVGKTYLNMHIIYKYCQDKIKTKVRGRKVLIMDTNGEFTKEQFERNNINNFDPKIIAVKDIAQWSLSDVVECRRIDGKSLSIAQKKDLITKIVEYFRNGMLVLEDINTYIINVAQMEEIVGGLVNLRHRGVDMIVSYQSLRAVEPRMYTNSRWVRMHYQSDNVDDVKGKIPNVPLYKIAQIIVNDKYLVQGDKRFYLYISNGEQKITGRFSKREFKNAVRKYLYLKKARIKEQMSMENVKEAEAVDQLTRQFYIQYYGNADK